MVSPEYEQILRELVSNSSDIDGAAIVTPYGVQVASVLPDISTTKFLSSAVASAVSLSASLVMGAGKGYIKQFSIKVAHGYLVVLPLLDGSLLMALCKEQAKLGLVFLDLGKAAKRTVSPAAGT